VYCSTNIVLLDTQAYLLCRAVSAHIRAEMTAKMIPKKEATAKDTAMQLTWFAQHTDLPVKQHIVERKLKGGQAASLIEELIEKCMWLIFASFWGFFFYL
jgi:hypothetical protein